MQHYHVLNLLCTITKVNIICYIISIPMYILALKYQTCRHLWFCPIVRLHVLGGSYACMHQLTYMDWPFLCSNITTWHVYICIQGRVSVDCPFAQRTYIFQVALFHYTVWPVANILSSSSIVPRHTYIYIRILYV